MRIGNRSIDEARPAFIIAEAGVNHNGDLAMARRLVDVAAEARADAVKFQTFKADRVAAPSAPKAAYQSLTTGAGQTQLDMIRGLELPHSAFTELSGYCSRRGILFLSTPFDLESLDFLDQLGVPAFKIASGELTNTPFLECVARKGKPTILSTGMAMLREVEEALAVFFAAGNRELALLHCVSNYPMAPEHANLRAMKTMSDAFGVPIGFSDHSEGIEISLAAAALGARIIEKHFTLDKTLPGPDHRASLEPGELAALVRGVRIVESSLGHGRKEPAPGEADTASVARRSVVAAQDIAAGSVISRDMLDCLRPGTGLPPSRLSGVVGRRAKAEIKAGAMISLEMLQ